MKARIPIKVVQSYVKSVCLVNIYLKQTNVFKTLAVCTTRGRAQLWAEQNLQGESYQLAEVIVVQ